VFHTSSAAPAYPLRAHAILFSASSTVALARISAGTSSGSGTESPTPTPEPTSPDAGVTPGAPVAVSWADRVRAKVEGTTLIKRGGCDGCADAGARSQQEIGQNGGYLEFTVDEPTALRFVGLSTRQAVTAAGEIDFALRIQAGYAEVRENGTYRAAIDLNAGDVLRISVSGNTVTYLRNGTRFYTSGVTPAWPMRAYATLLSRRSSVSKASIAVNQ
jgi:hypothetical protein